MADSNTPNQHTTTLRGEALHAFLNRAEALVQDETALQAGAGQGTIERKDRVAAAAELMAQQGFAPTHIYELERVHDFWLLLDQPKTANAFLQSHRTSVLQASTVERPNERDEDEVRLMLSDIQSRARYDVAGAASLLEPCAALIERLPARTEAGMYWNGWQHLAMECQAHDLAIQGLDRERVRERAVDEDERMTSYHDAYCIVRKARIARQRGDAAATVQYVHDAVERMRNAPAAEGIGFDQWMHLAEVALPLAPQTLPAMLMACNRHMAHTQAEEPSIAVQRHRGVKTARLQALACMHAGQMQAAIELASAGRYDLTDDGSDRFSAILLEWLASEKNDDRTAELALECALHARAESSVEAYRLALQRWQADGNGAPHAAWPAILAWSQIDSDYREMLEDESKPPVDADTALDMLRQRAPGHALIDLLTGMRHAGSKQMKEALPLLERAVAELPQYANSDVLLSLWAARFSVLDFDDAMRRPFPEGLGGQWYYSVGVILDDDDNFAHYFGDRSRMPADEKRQPLVLRYYEMGLKRFEDFWATGRGAFKDADLHVYSMLCNNLAIKYRYKYERPADAEVLHRKGLASSPFAEHHDGLWGCAQDRDDNEAMVREGEQLWHFARRWGYGRHDPTYYFRFVAAALYELDRDLEISIWLERLDQWYGELDAQEQTEQRRDYLTALVSMLDFFSVAKPELVLPRLRKYQPEVRALRECFPLRRLARGLETCGPSREEALTLLQEAQSNLKEDDSDFERNAVAQDIARVQKAIRGGSDAPSKAAASSNNPWWKFW